MKYFLVVYDQNRGQIEGIRAYSAQERLDALNERFSLEREYVARPEMEVVVLGAASKAALRKTHARYFQGPGSLVRSARPRALKKVAVRARNRLLVHAKAAPTAPGGAKAVGSARQTKD